MIFIYLFIYSFLKIFASSWWNSAKWCLDLCKYKCKTMRFLCPRLGNFGSFKTSLKPINQSGIRNWNTNYRRFYAVPINQSNERTINQEHTNNTSINSITGSTHSRTHSKSILRCFRLAVRSENSAAVREPSVNTVTQCALCGNRVTSRLYIPDQSFTGRSRPGIIPIERRWEAPKIQVFIGEARSSTLTHCMQALIVGWELPFTCTSY